MSNVAIQCENLGKLYRIGRTQARYDRLGEQVADVAMRPIRRAAKLMRGQATSASDLDEDFWALKDVGFTIDHGDVVGVVGHNGAGKSTLLKILSRITEPSEGYADIYGRVSSLLEVGTGFHPELTGRENVFLNGSILGMKKQEINRKFDAIVDFAEIEKFIDTPVKHYSSGMYVRLAFSVAAHLEPEILLVDEVLAVGDVAFQKKCLGKMDNVSKEGRTIVFVSHNMNALQRLCPNAILLRRGRIVDYGRTSEIVEQYISDNVGEAAPEGWLDLADRNHEGSGRVRFSAVSYSSGNQATSFQPYPNGPLEISLKLEAESTRAISSVAVTLYDRYGTKLINADTLALEEATPLQRGRNQLRFKIDTIHLNPGIYTLGLWAADPPGEVYDSIPSALQIEVVEINPEKSQVMDDGLIPCVFTVDGGSA